MENFAKIEKADDDGLSTEEREMAEYFLSLLKESGPLKLERRDCALEIIELQDLIVSFESKHSLEELSAIIDSHQNLVREAAREDLIPIVAKLNILEKETNIAREKYVELQEQYYILSNAVGFVNGDKVRHE